jgi:hypothetical protein
MYGIFSSILLRGVAIVCAFTHITKQTEDPVNLLPLSILGNTFLIYEYCRIYAHTHTSIYIIYILRKKLVKCYIWSIAVYGAETWVLRAVDQKHLESFEMLYWRRIEKISWTDYVRN